MGWILGRLTIVVEDISNILCSVARKVLILIKPIMTAPATSRVNTLCPCRVAYYRE